ncbi:hypothetical protein PVAP13_9NG774500 [Panicum virgatum]|uniref:Uncharacterized protein n=1 Tax=Panicum virgatum TaxID=38727 RepID=A0A8T0MXX2_PANVG|nr:hypothetical protein PVAP13_9NG774500 [Panicum virgatum]
MAAAPSRDRTVPLPRPPITMFTRASRPGPPYCVLPRASRPMKGAGGRHRHRQRHTRWSQAFFSTTNDERRGGDIHTVGRGGGGGVLYGSMAVLGPARRVLGDSCKLLLFAFFMFYCNLTMGEKGGRLDANLVSSCMVKCG